MVLVGWAESARPTRPAQRLLRFAVGLADSAHPTVHHTPARAGGPRRLGPPYGCCLSSGVIRRSFARQLLPAPLQSLSMDWISLRNEPPITARWAYFDHAAVAPISGRAHR